MAKTTPAVNDKILTLWDYEADRQIMELDIAQTRNWPYWQNWLERETTRSFRYTGPDGASCTVVKEKRKSFHRNDVFITVWYAHKRQAGKLRRRYLGVSENLTYERLRQAAAELSKGF